MVAKKVMLAGNFGVGKTSLFNRFLHNLFDERYLTTIGVKVDSKVVELDEGEHMKLMLWDIAGEVSQSKVPATYWLGASGVIYVFDLTRPTTFEQVQEDLHFLRKKLPKSIIKIVANKRDLVTEDRISEVITQLHVDAVTSARTGEEVEEMFISIANDMFSQLLTK